MPIACCNQKPLPGLIGTILLFYKKKSNLQFIMRCVIVLFSLNKNIYAYQD